VPLRRDAVDDHSAGPAAWVAPAEYELRTTWFAAAT
jgi:hypothetical protein